MSKRHIISILMENESGALSRVAGLFSARGYNIESLTVAPTVDPTMSRLTLVTRGSEAIIEQITKQLNKLIDVVKLIDLVESAHIEREILLIKISVTGEYRSEVVRLAEIFRSRIVDVTAETFVVEVTGSGKKIDAFIAALDADAIIESARSGVTGIARGDKALNL